MVGKEEPNVFISGVWDCTPRRATSGTQREGITGSYIARYI